MSERKKSDRRTEYTVNAIKKAYLELMKSRPFTKITVTDICKLAEINRCTFYLHFMDAPHVMEVLKDDISKELADYVERTSDHFSESPGMFLDFMASVKNNEIYDIMIQAGHFRDCVSKACEYAQELLTDYFMQQYDITRKQAKLIAAFQVNGCTAISEILYGYTEQDDITVDNTFVNDLMQYGISKLKKR